MNLAVERLEACFAPVSTLTADGTLVISGAEQADIQILLRLADRRVGI